MVEWEDNSSLGYGIIENNNLVISNLEDSIGVSEVIDATLL